MKITLVGFENGSGSNSCLYNIGKEMSEHGYLRKLVCPSYKSNTAIDNKFLMKEPLPLRSLSFSISKVNTNISEKFPARYYNEQVLFDWFSQRHICKDTSLVMHTDSGLVRSLRKAKSQNIPTIILHRTLHPEHISHILEEESVKFGIRENTVFTHKKWNANRIKTLEKCERIFALSKLEIDSLCQYGIQKSKIDLIHHGQGADTNYFKPSNKAKGTFTVLFLGHKSLIKGVPYLLEAWKMLNLKNARLIVAGYQDNELIERYRREVQFEAPGTVNPLEYYHKAQIFVLPSLGDPFARTILEAMSCGLPVIISDMVGAKDIIEDGREGFIIPAKDVDALSEKIQYFHDNPSEIRKMGKNARKKAMEYTWESFANEVMNKTRNFLR